MRRFGFTRRSVLGSVGAASLFSTLAPASAPARGARSPDQTANIHTEFAFQALLRVGPARGAHGNAAAQSGSADILGGEVAGPLLTGAVQSGQISWQVDVGSDTVQLAAHYSVRQQDGSLIRVTDRGVHAKAVAPVGLSQLRTAPELAGDDGSVHAGSTALLIGLLDASAFGRGAVKLRVIRVA